MQAGMAHVSVPWRMVPERGGGGFAKFIALNIINVRAMRVAVQFVRKPNNLLCSERGFCVSSGRGKGGRGGGGAQSSWC